MLQSDPRTHRAPWQPLATCPANAVTLWVLMKPILVLLAAAAVMPDLNQLKEMSARFAPVKLKYDTSTLAAGDGAHGVRTAAFNLPNDERVVHEKGSARIMLKNVPEAKFRQHLDPHRPPRAARGRAIRPQL